MMRLADQVSMPPPPETPRKSARTLGNTSPGKRRFAEFEERNSSYLNLGKQGANEDVFTTPNERARGRDTFSTVINNTHPARITGRTGGLLSPDVTPQTQHVGPPATVSGVPNGRTLLRRDDSPLRNKSTNVPASNNIEIPSLGRPESVSIPNTALATEILDAMRDLRVPLTEEAVGSVKGICHRQIRKLQGVEKGRALTRQKLNEKEARIAELEKEVARLSRLKLGK